MKIKYQMRGLGIGIIVTAILMGVTTSHGIPLTDAEIMARASELGMVTSDSLKLTDVGGTTTPQEESQGKTGEENGADAEGNSPGSGRNLGDEEGQPGDGDDSESGESQSSGSEGSEGGGNQSSGSEDSEGGGNQSSGSEGSEGGGNQSSGSEGSEGRENHSADRDNLDGQESLTSAEQNSDEGDQASSPIIKNGDTIVVDIEAGMDSYSISLLMAEVGLVESAGEFDHFLCDQAYSRKIVNGTYEILVGASEEEIAKIITRDR